MKLSSIFKILILISLTGCGGALKRPDSDALVVNAKAERLEGYNVLRDYDANGDRLKSAQLIIRSARDLSDINGWICTNPVGLRNIKTSIDDTRDYISKHCRCQ